ncbi:class I SAM-dependent methyltransferase [Paenibacillus sp. FSL R7-0198]|uniref:class I SAM-dependent methyltransferase n=1 Tax=unclassified Paenibacillus TaxID=185978 RepID=UPI0030D9C5E1
MKCRVCGEALTLLEIVNDCRYEHNFLNTTAFSTFTKDIELYQCTVCSHLQTEYLLPDDYYDKYTGFGGASQYYGSLNLAENKIQKIQNYSLTNEKIFEIGCGTGTGLKKAGGYFVECLGIEPSGLHSDIAKRDGHNVINAYFDNSLDIGTGYSAFMSFQVFEHLHDFYNVLDYAYEILEPGGVGLINVPNGQNIVEKSLYHQIICEHVNYFTPFSLATMVKKSKFDILEIDSIDETIELDIYIRKPKKYTGFNNTKEQQKEKLQGILSNYSNITIWGAGAKSEVYSKLIDNSHAFKHLVDSSEDKIGLYINGIDLQIEKVQQSIIDESDAIIIFASSYNKEIMDNLRNTYGYAKVIVYFEGEEVLVQN